jgi:hypothetical protein
MMVLMMMMTMMMMMMVTMMMMMELLCIVMGHYRVSLCVLTNRVGCSGANAFVMQE